MNWAVNCFRDTLWGQAFTTITDHCTLQWLHRIKDDKPHLTWWYLTLQPYLLTVQYWKEDLHVNADSPSPQAGCDSYLMGEGELWAD